MEAPDDLLRETERRRLRALVSRDLDTARSLHADDYELITPGGRAISREQYLSEISSGELDYRVFEPASDMAVRVWGSVAALRYQVQIEVGFNGHTDSGLFWHTDVYECRGGRWIAVWSQATRIR